jgi:amino acid adenylation domain-containing protein
MTHLLDGFLQSCDRFPGRAALEVAGSTLTYADLEARAASLAATIEPAGSPQEPFAAFLAYRTVEAYVSVLGILAAGRGYVPLNPTFPAERNRAMLARAGCSVLVAAAEATDVLGEVLGLADRDLTVICLPGVDEAALSRDHPRHRFVPVAEDEHRIDRSRIAAVDPDSTAYLLFTSGSTGVPKGVPVSHRNVTSYLEYVLGRYAFESSDRFSQTFDMTFDLSVHDMFVCWASGACLVGMPHSSVMAPAKLIRDARLTVWFSVPSVIMFMQRLRLLKPGAFPALRISLFCGEALLDGWADAWQQAAPNSIVENVYGPTEATIAISHYRWNPDRSANLCTNGVVSIGEVFATQLCAVVRADGSRAPHGEPGELWLSGSQVTPGYLNDPEKTALQFVRSGWDDEIWYRTGDLVVEDDRMQLQYLGRVDHQIQVRGHRVELQEIDQALRTLSGNDSAIAVAWPVESGRADAVYAFLCAPAGTDTDSLIQRCGSVLPYYMVPKQVFLIDAMPVNANGKIDRGALANTVEGLLRADA